MQHRTSTPHNYAYKRQPSNHIHGSTFNNHLPTGHTTTIRQFQGNPYAPATTFYGAATQVVEEAPEATQSTSSSPLGNFNLASLTKYANPEELKGLMDRFGGLDGILATVTKVQKVMSTVGQIAPMAKVFTGILGTKRPNSNTEQASSDPKYVAARRKQTVKRSQVKNKGRRVQVTKKTKETRRSKVYSTSMKQR